MTKFNTYLESNDFDRLKRFFEEHGELQHYRKGNFFARQGEYSSQAALIKDGTFAYTHIDNEGKEHYVGFVFPDEFVADYTSFMRHSASQVNIIALKPSTIFSVNRQALHDFYNTDMETLRYNCLMAENHLRNGLFPPIGKLLQNSRRAISETDNPLSQNRTRNTAV